jgi:hypothetical protein
VTRDANVVCTVGGYAVTVDEEARVIAMLKRVMDDAPVAAFRSKDVEKTVVVVNGKPAQHYPGTYDPMRVADRLIQRWRKAGTIVQGAKVGDWMFKADLE